MIYPPHIIKRISSSETNKYGELIHTYTDAGLVFGNIYTTRQRYYTDGVICVYEETKLIYQNGTLQKGDIIDNKWTVDFINDFNKDNVATLVPRAVDE